MYTAPTSGEAATIQAFAGGVTGNTAQIALSSETTSDPSPSLPIWMNHTTNYVTLYWFAGHNETYKVYRGTGRDFAPSQSNLINTTQYGYTEDAATLTNSANVYYKVATESSGNVSKSLRVIHIVDGDDASFSAPSIEGIDTEPESSLNRNQANVSRTAAKRRRSPMLRLVGAASQANVNLLKWNADAGYTNAAAHPNIDYTRDVYDYYQWISQQSGTNGYRSLVWAGMARMAGGPIVRGFKYSQTPQFASELSHLLFLPGAQLIPDAAAALATYIQGCFIEIQQAIFSDLAWQQQAYLIGGMAEITSQYASKTSRLAFTKRGKRLTTVPINRT